jgi:hypothetical protein
MLDAFNGIARAVRGGDGEGLGELNERLRTVFAEFRLETVSKGDAVAVLPILREDAVTRYALPEDDPYYGLARVYIGEGLRGYESQEDVDNAVAVLFATGEERLPTPRVKPVEVALAETGPNAFG